MQTKRSSRWSDLVHRYLRIPYRLHVHEFQSPKRPKATYVFIHGIGNNLHSWDAVAALMPKNVRVIGIDLLGFGNSPKPGWVTYSAKYQARSVGFTLLGMRLTQRPILVGHSLGALISVEIAKRYPRLPKRLVLCSPPFYKPEAVGKRLKSSDDMLRELYRIATKHPKRLERYSLAAVKLGLANKSLNITQDNVASYLGALEASIINQTSLEDVAALSLPIEIFYGRFDPVVIKKHILRLAKTQKNITAKRLVAGHEIIGSYVKSLAVYLATLASNKKRHRL